jgi:phosphorylcholine metabolism protein LicD
MSGNLQLTGSVLIDAKKMLRKVCRILDINQIPYILEGGTLLGIIRENRLLPWDNDIDLTVTEEHLDKLLKIRWKFWLAGYRVKIRHTREERPHFPAGSVRIIKIKTRKFFIWRGIGLMDIFIKKKIDDKYYWLVSTEHLILKAVPADFYENLGRYNFEGYEYSVPRNYKDYLTYRYGDWSQTVKDYNFIKDDRAIIG